MSKKFIIGSSIALALILGGGAGFYFWNQASADTAVTKDFCNGTKGTAYTLCVKNAGVLRAELAKRDSTRFKQTLRNMDALRNFNGTTTATGATTGTTNVSTATGIANQLTIKATKAGAILPGTKVKATVYVPCQYAYYASGNKTASIYYPSEFAGVADAKGEFALLDSDVAAKAKTTCTTNKIITSQTLENDATLITNKIGLTNWYVSVTLSSSTDALLTKLENLTVSLPMFVSSKTITLYGATNTGAGFELKPINYAKLYSAGQKEVYTAIVP
jgi:hypothetical protein